MADVTTLEEAKRCPKCSHYGKEMGKRPQPDGKPGQILLTIHCAFELCIWYDTPYYITVNPDGTIPPARNHRGEPKKYIGFEGHDEAAQRIIDAIRNNPDTKPGTELGRR